MLEVWHAEQPGSSRPQGLGSPGSGAGSTSQWIFVRVLRTDTRLSLRTRKATFQTAEPWVPLRRQLPGNACPTCAGPLRRCPDTGTCPALGLSLGPPGLQVKGNVYESTLDPAQGSEAG